MAPKKGSQYTQKSLFEVWGKCKPEHEVCVKVEEECSSYEEFTCPICLFNLSKFTLDARTVHVNRCIDPPTSKSSTSAKVESVPASPNRKRKRSTEVKKETKPSVKPAKAVKVRQKPPIPEHKILEFDSTDNILAVDAFCYSLHDRIRIYLLTHFHSDHYGGISKSWYENVNAKLLICTSVTAKLVQQRYGVGQNCQLLVAKQNEWIVVPNTEMKVMAMDANHCPGAGIFIIQCRGVNYLHCGDFRVCKSMISELLNFKFQRCYLDTTYLNPMYYFPKQEDVINMVSQWIADKSNSYKSTQSRILDFFGSKLDTNEFLVVVGTYSIGKERLALGLAEALGTKIYCSKDKMKLLNTYEWPQLLDRMNVDDPSNSKVHLVPMRYTKKEPMLNYLKQYSLNFKSVLVLHPTGWTFNWKSKAEAQESATNMKAKGLSAYVNENATLEHSKLLEVLERGFQVSDRVQSGSLVTFRKVTVPYSEHSSFRELFYFVNLLHVEEWITTVNKSCDLEQYKWLAAFTSYCKLDLNNF